MHKFSRSISGMTAVAVLGAIVMTGTAQHARAQGQGAQAQGGQTGAPPQKKVKDQGEFDIYNEVIKAIAANNFAKAVTDLDTWKQKYPE